MLDKQVKEGTVKATATEYIMHGGDNSAEGSLGAVKQTLRRLGNLGRGGSRVPTRKNVETLAAARLTRQPGVDTVLDALRMYRLACTSGVVQLAPRHVWDYNYASRWLYHGARK